MTLQEILGRLEGVTRSGSGYKARCPAHEDKRASLSIREGKNGNPWLKCFAGCSYEQIADKLGIDQGKATSSKKQIVATYGYHSAAGQLLYQAVRYSPKDFRQRRPDGKGKWLWTMRGVTRVLYRLPELLSAPDAVAWLVEGEKDADRLAREGLTATTNAGGAQAWRKDYAPTLEGRRVVVVPDNDDPGRSWAAEVCRDLAGVAAEVRVLELPGLPEKGDVSDWLRNHTADELQQAAQGAPLAEDWAPAEPEDHGRVRIVVTTNIPAVVDALEAAVAAMEPAAIYQRAGQLVHVVRGADPPPGLRRPPGSPCIRAASDDHLQEVAARAASWVTADGRNGEPRPTRPPAWAVRAWSARGRWNVPTLAGVVDTPTLRPDGSVLDAPGYDAGTGLLFDPGSVRFPRVPQRASQDQATAALGRLGEVFADFPLQEASDRSAALGLLLTAMGRQAIAGATPLFAVRAHTPGTGKTLLVDVVSMIVTGRPAPRVFQATSEDEERKRLVTVALEGDLLVLIDNVDRPLGNGVLDATITSGAIRDRLLGQNQQVTAPWRAVLVATGNNLQVRGDLGRRVIPIDMDARCERPEERSGWRHDPLLDWVRQERPRLVAAALTVLRGYLAAGSPPHDMPPMGGFEDWGTLVRGALLWCGQQDPYAGRERIRQEAEPEVAALGAALQVWRERWGSDALTLPQAISEVTEQDPSDDARAVHDALGELDPKFTGKLDARRIGARLRSYRGRIVGGLWFEQGARHRKGAWRWCVRAEGEQP